MNRDPAIAEQRLAQVSSELARTPAEVQAILMAATSVLSRIAPVTWAAMVMNPDPETSRVVVANDTDPAMADWVEAYLAAIDRPSSVPTVGVSRQVIESGEPIVRPRVAYEDFLRMLSTAGQEFSRAHPLPHETVAVGMILVPMHVGGSVIGTLGTFDWRAELITEADLAWVQAVADRIAISVEHARLLGSAREEADRMDLVRAITVAARHNQDQRTALRSIVDQLIGRLDVDAAEILLTSPGERDFVLAASAGFRSPAPQEYRLPIDSKFQVDSRPAPVTGHLGDLTRNPRRSHFAREGFHTFVSVPLLAHSRLVGMLELYSRPIVDWDQGRLDFLETVGGLAAVALDHAAVPPATSAPKPAPGAPRPDLSELESDILHLITDGFTNREIAQHVHRSENTIKFHVRRILEKTGASNRTDLTRRATRDGWL